MLIKLSNYIHSIYRSIY